MSFAIFTDNASNLPLSWLKGDNVHIVPFCYYIDGVEYKDLDIDNFDGPAFYNAMIAGTHVTTSQINPATYEEHFRKVLEEGKDMIYICMSSGISGAYQSSRIAVTELMEEFPDRKIYTIDTRSASLAEGYFALLTLECRENGMTIDATKELIESRVQNMCQVFTVDDLEYLRRGGRISNFKATVASILNIKPLLKGNELGQIVNFGTVRGRKKSIKALADRYDKYVVNPSEQTVYIAHGNCQYDVEELKKLLNEKNPPKEIRSVMYEPVTGSHVGPGALALFFMGRVDFRTSMD